MGNEVFLTERSKFATTENKETAWCFPDTESEKSAMVHRVKQYHGIFLREQLGSTKEPKWNVNWIYFGEHFGYYTVVLL